MSEPTPEALDAAGSLMNKLDADHITEIRAASWGIATRVVALALDRFAAAAVERERERCRSLCRKVAMMTPNKEISEALSIEKLIRLGEQP